MKNTLMVFVCYAMEDKLFTREILALITQQHFEASRTNRFTPQERWQADIQQAQTFIYILSHNARKSSLCIQQWKYALKEGKHILVLKLDNAATPEELRTANTIDFLDFVEIGRQIADGVPGLRRDRYAADVTLRLFVAELADIQRRAQVASETTDDLEPSDAETTLHFGPDDAELKAMRERLSADPTTPEAESPWKKIARRFRLLRDKE